MTPLDPLGPTIRRVKARFFVCSGVWQGLVTGQGARAAV